MQHPIVTLTPEYTTDLATMQVTPSRLGQVDDVCGKLLRDLDTGPYPWVGNIDEFRFITGINPWGTSNFVPPTHAYC
jgi:hypothetical protein